MRSRRHGGDSRACADCLRLAGLLVLDNDGIGGDSLQACAEPDLDTAFHEKLVREGRKRCRHLRQDTLAALKQDQSQIALRYVVVGAHGLAQKIVHFRNAFDAGKSAAGNDECQEPLAAFGIAFRFCFLEHADKLIAEIQGITEIFERTRMLTHARNLRIIEPGPHGDHEMIVA